MTKIHPECGWWTTCAPQLFVQYQNKGMACCTGDELFCPVVVLCSCNERGCTVPFDYNAVQHKEKGLKLSSISRFYNKRWLHTFRRPVSRGIMHAALLQGYFISKNAAVSNVADKFYQEQKKVYFQARTVFIL